MVVAVVVDSSAWIDYFAGLDTPDVDGAVRDGSAVMSPIVVAELMTGAISLEYRRSIGEILQEVPLFDATLEHWMNVGELRRALRRKGLHVTIPDAHIAQCALDLDAVLLTRDAIFPRIARHTRLRLRR